MMPVFPFHMTDETLWRDVAPLLNGHEMYYADLREVQQSKTWYGKMSAPAHCAAFWWEEGYVARENVRQELDRVAALILIATSCRPDTLEQVARKVHSAYAIPLGPFKGLAPSAIVAFLHHQHAGNQQLIDRVREMGVFRKRSIHSANVDATPERYCPSRLHQKLSNANYCCRGE